MRTREFREHARLDPSAPAVIEEGGRQWTRGQLAHCANAVARAFRAHGLVRGDSIAIDAPNCAEFLGVHLGALQVGLYVVLVNWHFHPAEVAHQLRMAQVAAVVSHARRARVTDEALGIAQVLPKLKLSIGAAPGYIDIAEVLEQYSGSPIGDPVPGRVRLFTSATTGLSKAIDVPLEAATTYQERLLDLTELMYSRTGISPDENGPHLCTSVLYHAAPLDCVMIAIHLGHAVVLMNQWDPEQALNLVDRYAVMTSCMVPAMFVRMLKLSPAVRARYSLRSLRFISHGGAPCGSAVKRELLEWLGPILWELYGAAEGSGTFISPQDWLRYPGSVGTPHPHSEIRILDDDGKLLPANASGNVYMRRFSGDRFEYHDDPEKTRAAWRGDFCTAGDIGYLNEEGFLFICDRKSDMILSGGTNVYSAEIEQTLVAHPQVRDCAVFGVPDDLLGEAVRVVVEPVAGVEPSDALTRELMRFLAERLSAQKLPRRIEYIAAIPRDPAGKLYKRRLRDPHWVGRERNV